MPLSDRERQILEEIERNLHSEDPKFARRYRQTAPYSRESRLVRVGAIVFVIGFAILFAFFFSRSLLVGVVAFAAMVTGVVVVASSIRILAGGRRPNNEDAFFRRDEDGLPQRLGKLVQQWEQRLRERYRRL